MTCERRLFARATEQLLSEYRFGEAAAVAETASDSEADAVRRADFLAVARIARGYGAYLLSTPTVLRAPKLAFEISHLNVPSTEVVQEAVRLERLYEEALQSTPGTAFVQWVHAYHAAANFDGLRAMLWLHRAIAAIDTTMTVEAPLRRLGTDLRHNLDTAIGGASRNGRVVEVYGALQVVSDALHRLEPAQPSPLDRSRDFTLHMDMRTTEARRG